MSQTAAAERRRHTPTRGRAWLFAFALPLAVVGVAVWAVVASSAEEVAPPPPGLTPAAFADLTGVEVVGVAVTAGGGVLDLRFRVVDSAKAGSSHMGHSPLVVVDQESGRVLQTPFHGFHRKPVYESGHSYYSLLVNEDGTVAPGERVTVAFGHARLAGVLVR